jgi:glycerophosphoryl diester phosphodiesterase
MIEAMRVRTRRTRLAVSVVSVIAMVAVTAFTASSTAKAGAPENPWLTKERVLNMAHGGGLNEAPQETLYAYKTAAERGANALEMDLHMTLDGHVVAMHDSTVDRTTNGTGCIVSHTLAELKELDAAYTFVPGEGPVSGRPAEEYTMRGIATGDVAPPDGFTANDFTIATLEEIFQAEPDALMVMELKPTEVYQDHDCPAFLESLPPDQRPNLAAGVASLIEQYGMTDRVMVASFIDDLMAQFQALAPDVATSFPIGESLAVYTAFLAGDPLPNPNGHEAFQVPRSYGSIVITKEIVEYARANGVAVHFWTIDDPDEMVELLDWGADGLITDVPQVLSDVLEARGDPQPVVDSTTELASDPAGETPADEPVTFVATVTPGWPYPEVTGSVELRSDDELVGTAEVLDGRATFTIADLAVGPHTLTAAFTGSTRVNASSSDGLVHEVTASDTTSTTSAPPSSTAPPEADAADPDQEAGSTSTVQGSLPVTGRDLSVVWIGLALIASGALLAAVARRRTR